MQVLGLAGWKDHNSMQHIHLTDDFLYEPWNEL